MTIAFLSSIVNNDDNVKNNFIKSILSSLKFCNVLVVVFTFFAIFANKKIMQKTSIHICPVKASSEEHNQRLKPLDYVKQELTEKNQSVITATIPDTLKDIKQRYRASTGQRLQKKATPIREGVIVVAPKTTMKELQNLADKFEERFKIKTFQIYLHDDEGHENKNGEWKGNRHAHFVMNWTDQQGKSLKLSKDDMAEMQTITAETLNMGRGVSSDKKHLSAIQYKNEVQKQELREIEKERNKAKLDLIKTKAENYTAKTSSSNSSTNSPKNFHSAQPGG